MVELIDTKFRAHKGRYVIQCLLAAGAMALILWVLDFLSNAAVIASLGASSFIAFAMPHAQVSRPRFLLGGYAVGLAAGSLCHGVWQVPWVAEHAAIAGHAQVLPGAVAVALAIFVMTVTNTEHPPAAGVALGLVLNPWDLRALAVIAAGIAALVLVKTLLKPVLINLIEAAAPAPAAGAAAPACTQGDAP